MLTLNLMSMPEANSNALAKIPTPRTLLKRYGIFARKSLGQNFLADINIARKIVELSGVSPQETVIELGVGLGTLTCALAEKVSRVIGFEIDKNLINILEKENFLPENVEIRQGNILKLDYQRLFEEIAKPLILFGNLPYYLSSRLLWRLVEQRKIINFCTFMFQKEVAERLSAMPGSKNYGPLSVLLALTARVEKLMQLSPGCFYPSPEVHSTVVKITFLNKALPNEKVLVALLKAAFSKRRKKIAANLKPLGLTKDQAKQLLLSQGLSPDLRAEQIPPEKYLALACALEAKAS